jgi:hypothetical protein
MGSSAGPRQPTKANLIFSIDAADFPNSAMPLGCGGFNGSNQGMRSNINGLILQFTNGLRLTGREYYTGFAIDYPEGSYGGDAANRQGLTPGYDVRSGGKTYDASRSLHMWVRNIDTNSWISGYFRGFRLGGHCYDNYSGAENGYNTELTLFAEDYNTVKSTFPNAIFIIAGSHRADRYNSTVRNILYDLGMPTGTSLDNDYVPAPEWILVGKPGLGAGRAYGWVYENYTTNPNQVAHINFGLPLKGVKSALEFDGSNDYLPLATNLQSGFTAASYEFVCNPYSLPGSGNFHQLYIQENSTWLALYNISGTVFFGVDLNNGSGWFDNNGGWNTGARTTATITANQYYHVMYTWEGAVVKVYLNGVLQSTTSTLQAANSRQDVTVLGGGTTHRNIGSRYSGAGNNWYGTIDVVNFYNRGLSATEVTQQYNNYRKRFPFDVAIGTQANPATSATAIQTANPDAQDGV